MTPQPDAPYVSICIPTLRGWEHLVPLLKSLEQHTPYDHEIVIVDSANRSRGYTVPMNQALRASRGQIIIPLNDDLEVQEGWIEPLVSAIEAGHDVVFPDLEDAPFPICGWCWAMSRHWLDWWGGFDEQFVIWCTEIDLCQVLNQQGAPAVRVPVPKDVVVHKGSTTGTRPELQHQLNGWCQQDLITYQQKWGSDAPGDKFRLGAGASL